MSVNEVGVHKEMAALAGNWISLWLLVTNTMSSQSIKTCLTQQNFDTLSWLEFNFLLMNNCDGYTTTLVKWAQSVWHVVVLVISKNISVWYLPLMIHDNGYTGKHTLVMDDL